MQQYKLIEYIKLDGVVVTVEDAAAYLGTSISTIVYRAMNFTKSMYEGHVIERCEISADKASKLVKPSFLYILTFLTALGSTPKLSSLYPLPFRSCSKNLYNLEK